MNATVVKWAEEAITAVERVRYAKTVGELWNAMDEAEHAFGLLTEAVDEVEEPS